MMQDNDGLITCPYIGDIFFCPSQACLKNYKLNKSMIKMTKEKAPKNVRRVNKNKNLLQLQSESIEEFSQLEVEYWYERSRLVEPLCLDKDTEKVIKDFLSRWIKRAYESGKRGKIK